MKTPTSTAQVPCIVIQHEGIFVVRDDLHPCGSTKARFMPPLFDGVAEVVYACPVQGSAQAVLAATARMLGKKATIFTAARKKQHQRVLEARSKGATVHEIRPGNTRTLTARARAYARQAGARLLPLGLNIPGSIDAIVEAASGIDLSPDEVWCAGGSGLVAQALAKAWPHAALHVVQVAPIFPKNLVPSATVHIHPQPLSANAQTAPPFPSDPNFDAKAWEVCKREHGQGVVLFWNVAGGPSTEATAKSSA